MSGVDCRRAWFVLIIHRQYAFLNFAIVRDFYKVGRYTYWAHSATDMKQPEPFHYLLDVGKQAAYWDCWVLALRYYRLYVLTASNVIFCFSRDQSSVAVGYRQDSINTRWVYFRDYDMWKLCSQFIPPKENGNSRPNLMYPVSTSRNTKNVQY